VVAVFLEFLQQLVAALAFWNHGRRPEDVPDAVPGEIVAQGQWQKILGEEDAHDVV